MKKCILFFTIIILTLSLCACTDSARKDTGGDTDVGGLFWDVLQGVRGDEPGDAEQENNDTTKPILQENCEKEGVIG